MGQAIILDVGVQPIYDTGFIPTAGVNQLLFFSTPLGQGISNWNTAITKTLADTNLDIAGMLPAGYNFMLLGFTLLPTFSMTIADATLAFNSAVFIFKIGSKDYLTVPARMIPEGAGVWIGGAGSTTVAGLGVPKIDNYFRIARQPQELAQTQNFGCRLVWPGGGQAVTTTMASGSTQTGAAGLPLTCALHGFMKRLPQ